MAALATPFDPSLDGDRQLVDQRNCRKSAKHRVLCRDERLSVFHWLYLDRAIRRLDGVSVLCSESTADLPVHDTHDRTLYGLLCRRSPLLPGAVDGRP